MARPEGLLIAQGGCDSNLPLAQLLNSLCEMSLWGPFSLSSEQIKAFTLAGGMSVLEKNKILQQ